MPTESQKESKQTIFHPFDWSTEIFFPENTDLHYMLGKLWKLEEWTPAKQKKQENAYLL